jgi:hypothetical protein
MTRPVRKERTVGIRLTFGNIGCLRAVLGKSISDAERHLRVFENEMSEEARDSMKAYLTQLRECVASVEKARTYA